jgi:hypothetical protein
MKKSPQLFLLLLIALLSTIGFMVKLPRVFHNINYELHALFYLFAYIAVTFLYPRTLILSTIGLLLFGICIEFSQEFSNKITYHYMGRAIHGRFDIIDVKYNAIGIGLGILCRTIERIIGNVLNIKVVR